MTTCHNIIEILLKKLKWDKNPMPISRHTSIHKHFIDTLRLCDPIFKLYIMFAQNVSKKKAITPAIILHSSIAIIQEHNTHICVSKVSTHSVYENLRIQVYVVCDKNRVYIS